VAVVVAGATIGSWFLLKMFLMVAEGTAGAERKRRHSEHPRGPHAKSLDQRTRRSCFKS
jgi:hypothetical protein